VEQTIIQFIRAIHNSTNFAAGGLKIHSRDRAGKISLTS
jgi:hypothetical protein